MGFRRNQGRRRRPCERCLGRPWVWESEGGLRMVRDLTTPPSTSSAGCLPGWLAHLLNRAPRARCGWFFAFVNPWLGPVLQGYPVTKPEEEDGTRPPVNQNEEGAQRVRHGRLRRFPGVSEQVGRSAMLSLHPLHPDQVLICLRGLSFCVGCWHTLLCVSGPPSLPTRLVAALTPTTLESTSMSPPSGVSHCRGCG